MPDANPNQQARLAEIFSKINMSELPAMSVHVQELLDLTNSSRSVKYDDLAKIILKDFSLTNKVLQFANSAYYSLGQKVSTVSMAVAVLGFDTLRDLAIGIALFDDFVQAGVDKKEISALLSRSFLGGILARGIAESRYLKVLPEEAFICGLMRNLGKIVTCIYLPSLYRDIEARMKEGVAEADAAREALDGLSYEELGREVALFWNMTENVITCMRVDPEVPEDENEIDSYLHYIVDFSSRFVDCLCFTRDYEQLLEKYGFLLSVDEEEAVELLEAGVDASREIFESIVPEIPDFDFQKRLEAIDGQKENVAPSPGKTARPDSGNGKKRSGDLVKEVSAMLQEPLRLEVFFPALIRSLHMSTECDRVILFMLQARGKDRTLAGWLGAGDIGPEAVKKIKHSLDRPEMALVQSLQMCQDKALAGNTPDVFPASFQNIVKDRMVYLFPVCLKKRGIALLYLDQRLEQPKLEMEQIKKVRMFREMAEKAIEMKRRKCRRPEL